MADYECPKCKTEYNASGSPDDAGEQECDACGFMFNVEIEYEPSYYESCVEHAYGEPRRSDMFARPIRVCEYCHHAEEVSESALTPAPTDAKE